MNHHVASTVTGHVAWPCVQSTFWFSITFLAAEPLEQMMEWARGNDNHFTWAALTSLSWVKSSALCSLQNNSVRGNAELITAIRWQSAAQQGLGWEPEVVFFFLCLVLFVIVTVFDWQGNAQSAWRQGCVYEQCACDDETCWLSYCSIM